MIKAPSTDAGGPTAEKADQAFALQSKPSGPEVNQIESFLRNFGRKQPTLSFLDHETRRFYTKQYPTIRKAAWGAKWWNEEKGRSVYFVGNSHRMAEVSKPTKADIELAVGVWLDVDGTGWDPDVASTLVSYLDWVPTYVAFTGGGYQAHWRFDQYTADTADAEAVNLWLRDQMAAVVQVDKNCWTCDHVWRLPGTINRKPGRQTLCSVVHADWAARLPMAEVGRATPPVTMQVADVTFAAEGFTMERVRECLSDRAFWLLVNRPDVPSRSEHEFAFLGAVLGERCPISQYDIDLVAACLLGEPVDEFSVSHRAYYEANGDPRSDPERHVAQQIKDWLKKNGRQVDA